MHVDPQQDEHAHRNPAAAEAPLDAANQSLADALRASFSILKGIMMVLLVLYLFSNVQCIEGHEQALVLRLGALREGVRPAGLVGALPFPIDEVLRLPTKASNELIDKSHTFKRRPNEEGKPLSFIHRGHGGLDPVLDGALMTADKGLVHVEWKITFKIEDVRQFISTVHGDGTVEAAKKLLHVLIETTGVEVASALTAEEVIRTRTDDVQARMKRRLNERLASLETGIVVSLVKMHQPTPPIQVRDAFDATQRAENRKRTTIRDAQKNAEQLLNDAAGAAHRRLIDKLDAIELARSGDDPKQLAALERQLDELLELEVEGQAGKMLKDAGAYYEIVVGRMESDVAQYQTLLPEFKRNPAMLIARLWEQALHELFASPGVVKLYIPAGVDEFRLHIGPDPQQQRIEEVRRLQGQTFDPNTLREDIQHPMPVGYDG